MTVGLPELTRTALSIREEARAAAKWVVVLFLPTAIAVLLLAEAMGGLHGDGKVVLLIASAPMMLFGRLLGDVHPITARTTVVIVEVGYLYFVLVAFRLLKLNVAASVAVRKALPYLKGRRPPGC